MRFLAINRWQGALLGCYVGERLQLPNSNEQDITPYLQIGQQLLESLIKKRQLTKQDWINLYQQHPKELIRSRSGDLILAVLPLILLYHDSRAELEQQLDLLKDSWQQPESSLEDVLIWREIIDLALREQLTPQHWLDNVIRVAQTRQSPLGNLLQLVKQQLKEALPLHQSIKQLRREGTPQQLELALSLYCFGSTPDDFRLSILRASRTAKSPSLAIALTGLLSGLYNSTSGFPLAWRLAYQNSPITQPIHRQTVQLFAVWSGIYEDASDAFLKTPLAAYGVIQQRTSLNIISQNRPEI